MIISDLNGLKYVAGEWLGKIDMSQYDLTAEELHAELADDLRHYLDVNHPDWRYGQEMPEIPEDVWLQMIEAY